MALLWNRFQTIARQCPANTVCLSVCLLVLTVWKIQSGFHGPPHVLQQVPHQYHLASSHGSQGDSHPYVLQDEEHLWYVTAKNQSQPEIPQWASWPRLACYSFRVHHISPTLEDGRTSNGLNHWAWRQLGTARAITSLSLKSQIGIRLGNMR